MEKKQSLKHLKEYTSLITIKKAARHYSKKTITCSRKLKAKKNPLRINAKKKRSVKTKGVPISVLSSIVQKNIRTCNAS